MIEDGCTKLHWGKYSNEDGGLIISCRLELLGCNNPSSRGLHNSAVRGVHTYKINNGSIWRMSHLTVSCIAPFLWLIFPRGKEPHNEFSHLRIQANCGIPIPRAAVFAFYS